MFFVAPLSPRRKITVVLRISKQKCFLIYPTVSKYLCPVWYSILLASFFTSLSVSPLMIKSTNRFCEIWKKFGFGLQQKNYRFYCLIHDVNSSQLSGAFHRSSVVARSIIGCAARHKNE